MRSRRRGRRGAMWAEMNGRTASSRGCWRWRAPCARRGGAPTSWAGGCGVWAGGADRGARRLRAVDPATFIEDSLRVLRAVQLAARLEFDIEPGTADLCRQVELGDLPAERIWGEVEKLLLKAPRPSVGLE